MSQWQLQDAKARLSEVVKKAGKVGPQNITVHGELTAVVISWEDYQRLIKPKASFVDFMRKSPLVGVDLDTERDDSDCRDVDL